MADTATTPTRRAILGALAVSPIAIATPAIATDRTEWEVAKADYRTAYAAWDKANDAHNDAQEAYFACRPERPKFTTKTEVDWGKFGKHVIDTKLSDAELDDPELVICDMDSLADMRRQLAEYRAADAEARAQHHVDAIEAAEKSALTRMNDALKRLLQTPAPDLAALAEKIGIVVSEYGDDSDWAIAVLRDVKSLGGVA